MTVTRWLFCLTLELQSEKIDQTANAVKYYETFSYLAHDGDLGFFQLMFQLALLTLWSLVPFIPKPGADRVLLFKCERELMNWQYDFCWVVSTNVWQKFTVHIFLAVVTSIVFYKKPFVWVCSLKFYLIHIWMGRDVQNQGTFWQTQQINVGWLNNNLLIWLIFTLWLSFCLYFVFYIYIYFYI